MTHSSIEKEIAEKGRLTYTGKGISMWPLIRQKKDVVVIERPKGRLKKNDVALYKTNKNKTRYTLHRIIGVTENGYVCRGDNCMKKEYGITEDMIVGVMTELYRSGKKISLDSFGYKAYVVTNRLLFPVRYCFYIVIRVLRKIKRTIIKQ
jgi:hypothetical protein